MTPPPFLKSNKCPYCNYKPANTEESWWTFDYMTIVNGPKIETVAKCNHCHGKFILASEPLRRMPYAILN